ncbi:MAG: hypothetical protein ABEN55_21795 [Bradymonadaceae bacterium]
MAFPSVRASGAASLLVGAVAALTIGLAPVDGHGEEVHLPRIGQQFLAVGLALQPGFLYDETHPDASQFNTVTPTAAGMSRFAFHQILSERLMMSAEADLGLQWFNDHTAHIDGRADSEIAFGWQLGLYGRWLPFGERNGWEIGGGPQLYQVHLAGQPLQSLGLGVKAGRYIWQSTEEFVLVELGYSVPFIQGLLRNNDIVREDDSAVPKNWTFHRFSISVQYGF